MGAISKREVGDTAIQITELGFGGAPLGGVGAHLDEEEADRIVRGALDAGLNYFDTAPLYGHGLSEKRLGRVLAGIPREDFVLSSKVGRCLVAPDKGYRDAMMRDREKVAIQYDYSYDGALRSIEQSLVRLGLDRIDVVYCHDIDVWTHGTDQARVAREAKEGILPALEDLKSQGVIGAWGLGVNEWQICHEVLRDFSVDVFLLAGRFTLLEQSPLEEFLPQCLRSGVSVVVGGPYNSGLLTVTDRKRATYDYKPVDDERWQRAQALREVCAEVGVELGHAALQYPLRHPAVASVIPGTWKMRELEENLTRVLTPVPDLLWTALEDAGLIAPLTY